MSKFLFTLLVFFSSWNYGSCQSDIAITEWITNPGGSDATDEWMEIFNFGAVSVDIQNWRVEDEDADDDLITASSFVIPAGGYVILAKNKAAFETQWLGGFTNSNVIEVAGLTLANGADELIIRDASSTVVWSLAYQNDDASGIAAHYTDAPTFTNTIWGSKASTGVDRTGNDPATGTLGYENNNTTADPFAYTSTTGDIGSPFDEIFPLPVELIYFDGIRLNDSRVQLDWTTASERNNEGFVVERMLETENEFKVVAYFKGVGYSNEIINYQLFDENSIGGVSYYRLKQVDFDGEFSYSQVKSVAQDDRLIVSGISIYPNPVKQELNVQLIGLSERSKTALIKVLSISGNILFESSFEIHSNNTFRIDDISELSSGFYLLSVELSSGESFVQKFFKE